MQGVILQTYGAGNVPDTGRYSYVEELKAACDRGVIVVNCTQCSKGKVSTNYAGGIVSYVTDMDGWFSPRFGIGYFSSFIQPSEDLYWIKFVMDYELP